MVHLSRIYTRSGDDGSTGLGDGTRVPKHGLRVSAYGTVDELSATIGLVLVNGASAETLAMLQTIQNDLFDAGADLTVPVATEPDGPAPLRLTAAYTERLEGWIDACNEDLEPLNSFVLPGGSIAAAWLHLARTVCRRAERLVTALVEEEGEAVNPEVVRFMNRLSDLLFVLSRKENGGGKDDVLWRPGGGA